MKKTMLGLSAAVMLLSFASCKKDYSCTCEYRMSGASADSVKAFPLNDQKRGDAHDACDKLEDGYRTLYGSTAECEIGD